MTEGYDHEKYRAEVAAREQREAEARRESAGKGAAYAAWVADGGSAADFEKAWPKLRDELRRRRLVDADERARAEQRNTGVSRI